MQPPATFTIVGVADSAFAAGGATFALFEFKTAQQLLDSKGKIDLINVVVENNFEVNEIKNIITDLDSEKPKRNRCSRGCCRTSKFY